MKDNLWVPIYDLFQEMAKIHQEPQRYKKVKGDDDQSRIVSAGLDPKTVVKLRSNIRTQLELLKSKLSEKLTEREVYLVLFPIVVYFDEMVMYGLLSQQHSAWRPLQKELFQIDNGGEVFYDTVDDIIRKPQTLPFVYEIFYYCLSDGFKGKYEGNVVKINDYKKLLRDKIPLPERMDQEEKGEGLQGIERARFPFWYYSVAVVLLVCVYGIFYMLAN